jgi:hypothetical protein
MDIYRDKKVVGRDVAAFRCAASPFAFSASYPATYHYYCWRLSLAVLLCSISKSRVSTPFSGDARWAYWTGYVNIYIGFFCNLTLPYNGQVTNYNFKLFSWWLYFFQFVGTLHWDFLLNISILLSCMILFYMHGPAVNPRFQSLLQPLAKTGWYCS